jgi:signal transduction histidine kinase/ActR/RegA family two-component response regulator
MEDPIRSEQARTLNTVILAISALCVLLVLATPVMPAARWDTTIGFYGPLGLVQVIAWWLLRRRYLLASAWFYSTFIFVTMSATLWLFGGLTAQNSGSFILVVLIAGFVIGGRGALVFAVLSIVMGAFVLVAENSGRLPEPVLRLGPEEVWAGLLVNTTASALLVHLALRRLLNALRTARDRERFAAGLAEFGRKVVGIADRDAVYQATLQFTSEVLSVERAVIIVRLKEPTEPVVLAFFPRTKATEVQDDFSAWTSAEILSGDEPTVLAVRLEAGDPAPGTEGFLQTLAQVAGTAITRAAAEEELRQAQKLEVVGLLAGGIAHDFNNLLTSMLGAAKLMQRGSANADNSDLLDVILRGGERASLLTKQILAFASNQPSSPTNLDLNRVVADLIAMLRRVIPERISIGAAACSDRIVVFTDRSQLEQVILNLVVNARDAIEEGGHIELTTCIETNDDETSTATLTVKDDGRGMEPAVAERIFQPFFTTKQGQGGTGLGLSTVKRIVDGFGGRTEVESRLGEGSAFKVYLPAVLEAHEVQGSTVPTSAHVAFHAKVLLVEDEPTVRRVLSRALEESGLTVIGVEDGRSALELIDSGAEFDVVVSDLVMPRMGGGRLANILAERHGSLPVVLLSGYAGETTAADLPPGVPVLSKPVEAEVLVDAIQSAVAAGKPASRTA